MNKETVTIDIDGIKFRTEKALCITVDKEETWLPLSQVEEVDEDELTVTIPVWIAEGKGLI